MSALIEIAYIVASVLFILGIKGLTKPKTAVRGNHLAGIGMLIAVIATVLKEEIVSYEWIIIGGLIGAAIGAIMAKRTQMTSMPQFVALLNGFGGGGSLAVAIAEFIRAASGMTPQLSGAIELIASLSTGLTILIGAVTLTGSLIAFAKLQELISSNSIGFPGLQLLNATLFVVCLACIGVLLYDPQNVTAICVLTITSCALGVLLVMPIGGADMPVVIALLNSYSGLAASCAGFITGNSVLIISGSLVGASGVVLTKIMCDAMNRSLTNVLFGVMGEASGVAMDADEVYAGKIKSTSPDELALILETARRVVIVPGYGLAMAQAQHAVRELANAMEARGTEVEYAIHPVAGRMPGHMNVLLAEAEVPYDKMIDMDTINPTFEQTDVAIVIGANDVTNPMAREDKSCPIYGMPILNVDKATTVVVVKRSLSAGFAGLPNPLFARNNTLMLFGDGKKAIIELTAALKNL